MKVRILSKEELFVYDIPMSVHERTFENFCDFKGAKAKLDEIDEGEVFSPNDLIDILKHMVTGDLTKLPLGADVDIEQLLESNYTITIDDLTNQVEISLWRLFAHVVNVIKSYVPESVPETFKLNFKGNNFLIKKRRVVTNMLQAPYTTGEIIEAREYQRIAEHNVSEVPKESGNIDFNLGLAEMAILVRQPGEELPSSKSKLTKFIDERKKLFRHMPLNHVLDLRFFFIYSLLSYESSQEPNSFGKGHQKFKVRKQRKWIMTGN